MVRTSLLSVLGGATLALALGACSGGPTGSDAGADANNTPGQTYTFVVNQLKLTTPDSVMGSGMNPVSFGFNLDSAWSRGNETGAGTTPPVGCQKADALAIYDNDQNCTVIGANQACTGAACAYGAAGCNGGVDNGLTGPGGVFSTIESFMAGITQTAQTSVTDNINKNKLALIVRILDVNNTQNDPSVTVNIYLGYPTATGAACMAAPVAGAEYLVDARFLNAGATNIDTGAKYSFSGKIEGGRVKVASGNSTTSLDLILSGILPGGADLTLALYSPKLNFDLGMDGMTAARGNLGAALPVSRLITSLGSIDAIQQYLPIVRMVVGTLVDVRDPMTNTCNNETNATPEQWGQLGVGLGLEMVRATIKTSTNNGIATAAPAGTCQAAASGG